MAENVDQDTFGIRKVDLDPYRFSPPGSMGWSSDDYEHILNHPEAAVQSDSIAPPNVPTTDLQELFISPDHSLEIQSLGKTVSDTAPTANPDKNEMSSQSKDRHESPGNENKAGQVKQQEEADLKYTLDTNPPAEPWLTKNINSHNQ